MRLLYFCLINPFFIRDLSLCIISPLFFRDLYLSPHLSSETRMLLSLLYCFLPIHLYVHLISPLFFRDFYIYLLSTSLLSLISPLLTGSSLLSSFETLIPLPPSPSFLSHLISSLLPLSSSSTVLSSRTIWYSVGFDHQILHWSMSGRYIHIDLTVPLCLSNYY